MRYAGIDKCELCNGLDIGASIYVQGCPNHCKNCFNPETWDFNGGKEWNEETKKQFFTLIDRPYIKRVTILGGEPLACENLIDVHAITTEIKGKFPNKKIWLYTGYVFNVIHKVNCDIREYEEGELYFAKPNESIWAEQLLRDSIIKGCDVLVDGAYIDELRDLTLPFRGSSNQRLIDVKQTLKTGKIVLWGDNNKTE